MRSYARLHGRTRILHDYHEPADEELQRRTSFPHHEKKEVFREASVGRASYVKSHEWGMEYPGYFPFDP